MSSAPPRTATLLLVAALCLPGLARGAEGTAEPIDLNTASEPELARLPGIGPKKARAIADERERAGPFEGVDALERVRGIGPATIDRLRPYARTSKGRVEPLPELSEPARTPRKPRPGTGSASARAPRPSGGPPLNVNVAGAGELAGLGLSPAAVQAVLERRPLRDLDALAALPGVDRPALQGRVAFLVDVNHAPAAHLAALGFPPDAAAKVVELREKLGPFERVDELASVPGLRPELVQSLAPYLVAR